MSELLMIPARMIPIPILGQVCAGRPDDFIPLKGLRWVRPLREDPFGRKTVCLQVLGDSMIGDGIDSGDYVVVILGLDPPPGRPVIVRTPHGIVVKRVEPRDGGMVALVSSNPSYPEKLWPAEEIRVLGAVKRMERDF